MSKYELKYSGANIASLKRNRARLVLIDIEFSRITEHFLAQMSIERISMVFAKNYKTNKRSVLIHGFSPCAVTESPFLSTSMDSG